MSCPNHNGEFSMLAKNWNQTDLLKAHLKIEAARQKMTKRCMASHTPRTRMELQMGQFQIGPHIRHLHLAYALLRGQPYSLVERTCHNRPNLSTVRRLATEYGIRKNWSLPTPQRNELWEAGEVEQEERIAEWLEDAKAHLKEQGH